MKQRGFTLIELLAVIVIIVMLFSFAYPAVKQAINFSKKNIKNAQIDSILTAAYNYTLENPNLLPEENGKTYIPLALLKHENLIDINIVDPDTEQPFSDDTYVVVEFEKTITDASRQKKEGSYLYMFEYNDVEITKPKIEFKNGKGVDTLLSTFNGASKDDILSITPDSLENYDVIINIVKDGYLVENVDKNTYGIYYITYTVQNKNKIASKTIRVTNYDQTAPSLTVTDTNITLTLNDEYDLNTGVSCTDESNCEIIINGNLDTTKKGTYVINYKARDSFGNTSEAKTRIIKVE